MEQKMYTGEIQEEIRNREQEYTQLTQEVEFTEEQHAIWADLYASIYQPHFMEHVCREYIEGLRLLKLSPTRIPTIAQLNAQITHRSGWSVERTVVRYTKAETWYEKFANRVFLVTDYLRNREQMEFTPEPDMFHDIFGHLPYLTQPFYAQIEDKFAPAFLKATDTEREAIKSLAWYSTEFGLVVEDNRLKVFGAGTISGRAEFANTIMEFYRLIRDGVLDVQGNIFEQLSEQFNAHREQLQQIVLGVQRLHAQGEMSGADKGWNVIHQLYDELGIGRRGYLGGGVVIAPFDLEFITMTPKTVYAFNPIMYVAESLSSMDALLDTYLKPISDRDERPT